jgi:hypothetical protein
LTIIWIKAKNQAFLPNDTNPTLVYDKTTQQWIDTSVQQNQGLGSTNDSNQTNGPPFGGPPITQQSFNKKFEFQKNKRYVDVFNK